MCLLKELLYNFLRHLINSFILKCIVLLIITIFLLSWFLIKVDNLASFNINKRDLISHLSANFQSFISNR